MTLWSFLFFFQTNPQVVCEELNWLYQLFTPLDLFIRKLKNVEKCKVYIRLTY